MSKPMQVMAIRLTDEERANLERIARERNVTLSYAMREGLKLYLQDARSALPSAPHDGPVITA